MGVAKDFCRDLASSTLYVQLANSSDPDNDLVERLSKEIEQFGIQRVGQIVGVDFFQDLTPINRLQLKFSPNGAKQQSLDFGAALDRQMKRYLPALYAHYQPLN